MNSSPICTVLVYISVGFCGNQAVTLSLIRGSVEEVFQEEERTIKKTSSFPRTIVLLPG
jgi:hypothetical protein